MKLTPLISTIASAVLALSLPFTLSKEKVNRPPVDPELTETPEPTPTPSPEKSVGSVGSQMPVIFEEWWLENLQILCSNCHALKHKSRHGEVGIHTGLRSQRP